MMVTTRVDALLAGVRTRSIAKVNCLDHTTTRAVTRCASCNRALCEECYRFRMSGHAACARCAYEANTRPARRASLAVAFVSVIAFAAFVAIRRFDLWRGEEAGVWVVGAIIVLIAAVFIARSGRSAQSQALEHRDPDDEPEVFEESPGPRGYGAGARRVLMAASPRISGSATALVLLACFGASAVLLPATVRLPRWVEAELVLGVWWAIVSVVTTTLLYRGFRLRDDFVYFAPWNRPSAPGEAKSSFRGSSKKSGSWLDGLNPLDGLADAEGCLVLLAVLVFAGLALGAAWVLVELALPVVFFFMYALFMRAIGRVANDKHDCQGALSRSVLWGTFWATVYVVPIALITWLLHVAHR